MNTVYRGLASKLQIRDMIAKSLSASEVRTMCFDLNIDYDGLRGHGTKAGELVEFARRRQSLDRLWNYIAEKRPHLGLQKTDGSFVDIVEEVESEQIPDTESEQSDSLDEMFDKLEDLVTQIRREIRRHN